MSEKKPNTAPNQMEKLEKQLDAYNENVQALTLDRMNQAPLKEVEEQTKLSQRELAKKPDVYLKPINSIRSKEAFNETFRGEWNHAKEYVHFIYENYEVIGEQLRIRPDSHPGSEGAVLAIAGRPWLGGSGGAFV